MSWNWTLGEEIQNRQQRRTMLEWKGRFRPRQWSGGGGGWGWTNTAEHAADWFLLSRGSVWDYGLSLVWEEIGSVYMERYYSRREKQIKSTNYSIGSVFLSQIHTYIPRTQGPCIGLHRRRRPEIDQRRVGRRGGNPGFKDEVTGMTLIVLVDLRCCFTHPFMTERERWGGSEWLERERGEETMLK